MVASLSQGREQNSVKSANAGHISHVISHITSLTMQTMPRRGSRGLGKYYPPSPSQRNVAKKPAAKIDDMVNHSSQTVWWDLLAL